MRPEDGSSQFRERFARSFLELVMMGILHRGPTFGYDMLSVIGEDFGAVVSPGSLYPILYNLERRGLVQGQWDHPQRKSRKMYRLTDAGERAYRDGLSSFERVLASMKRG